MENYAKKRTLQTNCQGNYKTINKKIKGKATTQKSELIYTECYMLVVWIYNSLTWEKFTTNLTDSL